MNSDVTTESVEIATIEAHGLEFCEVAYTANHWMSAHRHSKPQLVFMLNGAVEHQSGRDKHCMTNNSGGFVPADEIHSDLFLGNAHAFQIQLGGSCEGVLGSLNAPRMFHRNDAASALMTSVYREFKNPDSFTPAMLESLTVELLVTLHRDERKDVVIGNPPWLDRARDLLHDEPSCSLRIDDIACKVGVHPMHLTRAFRRRFGHSIGEYARQLRVARARHLLEVSDMPIGEIATATGFADQAHFTRTFKKYTGRTPKSYRDVHS